MLVNWSRLLSCKNDENIHEVAEILEEETRRMKKRNFKTRCA